MAVTEQIAADVRVAMKAGDRERAGQLRLLLSELQKDAKEGDGDELAVLRRERKRRRDAEAAFQEAGRDELAAAEAAEAELIDGYLPAGLSDAELDALVADAVAATGAQGPREMGAVIKQVMAAANGRADGKVVAEKARAALS